MLPAPVDRASYPACLQGLLNVWQLVAADAACGHRSNAAACAYAGMFGRGLTCALRNWPQRIIWLAFCQS
jgi:hypothetical protein